MSEELLENVVEGQDEKKIKLKKIFQIVIPILVIALSFGFVADKVTSVEANRKTIQILTDKEKVVMGLSGATAAVSTTASLILGDRAAPIASKLMDLTGYFIVILCAIILEKYLLTIMGLLSFKILLPLAALLYLIYVFINSESLKKISIKLAIFSIVMFLIIPTSVYVSNVIEKTYDNNFSTTIDSINDTKNEIESSEVNKEKTENIESTSIVAEIENNEEENIIEDNNKASRNIFENIVDIGKKAVGKATETGKNFASTIEGGIKVATEKGAEMLNKLTDTLAKTIEAIAVMIVTTCIIPLLILFLYFYIVKLFFNVNIDIPKLKLPKIIKNNK